MRPISGSFMGLAQMDSLSPDDSSTLWYHENTMFIRNNELIYHLDPVTIRNGVKSYSASDGGFMTYRGRIFTWRDGTYIALRLIDSDFIPFPATPQCEPYSRIIVFPIKIANGTLILTGVQYKPTTLSKEKEQMWAKALADHSVEYTGKERYKPDSNAAPCIVPFELEHR